MPYTPEEQRIVNHVSRRLSQHRDNLRLWHSGTLNPTEPDEVARATCIGGLMGAENELQRIKELLEDIKATRDKEYPIGQKGE